MANFYVLESSYKTYLESIGVNAELVLKKADISYKSVGNEGISISGKQYIALMENLNEVVGDETIIALSNIDKIMMFIPALFAAMCANDGIICYQRISK